MANLVNMPWIKAVQPDGITRDLSLGEAFTQAARLRALSGDLPTQDVSVLRLLLAITLVAVADERRNLGRAIRDWEVWWRDWSVLNNLVQEYLAAHEHEFEMLDAEVPFMQAAGLEPAGDLPPGIDRLVPDLGNWFSTRQGPDSGVIGVGEAARWLLHLQSFDIASIKTGIKGDPTVKDGKAYPTGYPAWSGNLGLVVVEGATLAQTLLLNLPIGDYPNETMSGWTRPQPLRRSDTQTPRGPAELFAWTSRRVLLHPNSTGEISGIQVSYGDTLTPQNMNSAEPMSAWRLSEAQTKKAKHEVLMPVQHSVERQVWRGLGALLADRNQRPATLKWLDLLRDKGVLEAEQPLEVSIVGIEYGPQNGVISSLISDSFSAELIAITDRELTELAARCAEGVRPVVGALTHLNYLLARAAGTNEEKARDRAAVRGYAGFDPVFRLWLASLHDPMNAADYEVAWQKQLRGTALQIGQQLCDLAGNPAQRGRKIDGELMTTSSAWSWFRYRIGVLTPLARPQQTPEKTNDSLSEEE